MALSSGADAALAASALSAARVPVGRPGTAPNLVLITLDTLRADHLGAYGFAGAETPVLDRLAAEGVLFLNAASTAPLTLPAHASILTGQYPFRHRVRDNLNFRLRDDALTLAEILVAEGYATGGFIGAVVLDARSGIGQGFQAYSHFDRTGVIGQPRIDEDLQRRGSAVVREASTWISAQVGPFFAWVHLFDPHLPYDPPPPYDRQHANSPYDGEIAFTDSVVGSLLRSLADSGHLDDTVVVVAGDHGEGLGEHGEERHSFFVYDSTIRVPLILWARGLLPSGRVVQAQASLVDILPTCLAVLNVEDPAAALRDGVDLRPLMETTGPTGRLVYAESLVPMIDFGWSDLRSLRSETEKYIAAPRRELYDLEVDRNEIHDVAASSPKRVAVLRAVLDEMVVEDDLEQQNLGNEIIDDQALRQLRSLGYISGGAAAQRPRVVDPKDKIRQFESFQDLVGDVDQALQQGRLDAADALLAALDQLVPDHHLTYQYRGRTAEARGDYKGAIEAYEHAIALGPAYTLNYVRLAGAYRTAGESESASRLMQVAVETFPDTTVFPLLLGSYLHEAGKLDEALDMYLRAQMLAPRHPLLLANLAHLHVLRGEVDAAISTLETLVGVTPGDPDCWLRLGVLLGRRDDLGAARDALAVAVELAPGRADLQFHLGQALQRLGLQAEAEAAFRSALDLEPGMVRARDALKQLDRSPRK
jgi:arylsulfatase A-like enzyme/Flp pilus assembly protein TadD